MLQLETLPAGLAGLVWAFRSCFTAPTLRTFAALVAGMIAQPGSRTVCGMLVGAGLSRVWHHSRAHRFFASALWSADQVGLVVLRLAVGLLLPAGAVVVLAVDDTLFLRSGRKVIGAGWARDGSADRPERAKIAWGTCFVVVGLIVWLPFTSRPVCLPVAARLCPPKAKTSKAKTSKAKTSKAATAAAKSAGREVSKQAIAAELVAAVAGACPDRRVHVVADGWYTGTAATPTTARGATRGRAVWPAQAHLSARLRANAALHALPPPPAPGKPGAPRKIGDKLGTPKDLAATLTWRHTRVRRYGRVDTVQIAQVTCLWPGVYRSRPIRIILVRDPGSTATAGYDVALLSTDLNTDTEQIIAWYAARWSLEATFQDAKGHTGVGQARNRTRQAVERTVPFGLYTQSLTIIWYARHGYQPEHVTTRRLLAPWYRNKTEPSYQDMIVTLRRTLITARFKAGKPRQPTPEEILEVSAAWAEAAA
jgi:DDE superfamily endonuclease